MVRNNRKVTIMVDEDFFKILERERRKTQRQISKKVGSQFNLTNTKFTKMLAKRGVKFKF